MACALTRYLLGFFGVRLRVTAVPLTLASLRSLCRGGQPILLAYMPFTFVMAQTIQATVTYGSPFHSVDQRATVYLTFLSFTLLNICPTSHFSPGTRTLGYKEHRKEVKRIMISHWIEHSTKTYKNKKLRHNGYKFLSSSPSSSSP